MGIWYATREDVKDSLEANDSVASNRLIDRRLDAASRAVEGILKRRFYPERKTVIWDYPNYQYASSWRLWLEGNEMISAETVVSGGITLGGSDYFLRRGDGLQEPPYDALELDTAGSGVFSSGDSSQRAISVTGLFGWNDTDTSIASAALGANINSSTTSITLTPTGGVLGAGVGSIILIGTERLVLTERRMTDTTINTTGTLAASVSDDGLTVSDGSVFGFDEVIMVGTERMRINDIAGNTLVVDRGFDGTTLAAHASGQDVYAARLFTAARGSLGTTAASHTTSDPVYTHHFSSLVPLVHELTVAMATVLLELNAAGYTEEVGASATARKAPGGGLSMLIDEARQAYGRVSRSEAI